MDMETARYTILIVEDDDTIARLVSDRLSRWGMETVVVEDFSAVLDTFVKVAAPSGAAGYFAALLQRVPLVRRNPPAVQGTHYFPVQRVGLT